MKPTIGRIVIYVQGDHEFGAYNDPAARAHPGTNGTREHPAIITRVWGDTCVNLQVFFDAYLPDARSSVVQLPELPEGTVNTSGASGWKWPPRV